MSASHASAACLDSQRNQRRGSRFSTITRRKRACRAMECPAPYCLSNGGVSGAMLSIGLLSHSKSAVAKMEVMAPSMKASIICIRAQCLSRLSHILAVGLQPRGVSVAQSPLLQRPALSVGVASNRGRANLTTANAASCCISAREQLHLGGHALLALQSRVVA
jgi:hypothetical protein